MGSFPLLPLELEAKEAAPSMSMHELGASLFPPPEVLTCSADGANLFWSALAELIIAGPLRAKHGLGGSVVPNLIWVPVGTRVSAKLRVPAHGFCASDPVGGC